MGGAIQAKRTPIVEHSLHIRHFTFYRHIPVGEFAEGMHVAFENAAILMQITT